MASLKLPGQLFLGAGSVLELERLLKEHARVVLMTDRGVRATGICEAVVAAMERAGCVVSVVDNIPSEPSLPAAQEAIEACRESQADAIVAVGGGSVMDVAKLASLLPKGSSYELIDLVQNPLLGKKSLKTVMIPTTAGTGAEATGNAIVTLPDQQVKQGIVSPEMVCDYVILDPDMTRTTPIRVATAACIDALAHAIECFTSLKATPLSDLYALEALRLIFSNAEAGCLQGEEKAREALLMAAYAGGAAIAGSGTTAVHALSYPLGGRFHIPHGISNAILLSPVMRFNEPCCREKFARVHDMLRPQCVELPQTEKSEWLLKELENLVEKLGIPKTLGSFGVTREHLEWLVDAGMQVTRLLNNNPRTVSADDARKLYLEVLD